MYDTKASKQTHETFDTLRFAEQKGSKLESVPYINMYKKRQKPYITEQQRAKVQNMIIIDHQSSERYHIRQAIGDYYLNHTCNPFLVLTEQEKRQLKMAQTDQKNKTVNFVDILAPIKEERRSMKRLTRETNAKQFQKFKKSFELTSQKIVANCSKKKDESKNILSKKVLAIQIFHKAQKAAEINSAQLQIETIAAGRQENFFFNKTNKLNIFKMARDQIDCISGLDKLRRRYFDEKTMVERTNPVRIPIFRDLSNIGRTAISNQASGLDDVQQYVNTDQLVMSTKQLQFKDLMSFASNRLSAQYLHKLLSQNQQQDRSDSSSMQQTENIIYRRTNQNKMCFNKDSIDAHQIQIYRNLPFNEQEQRYQEQLQTQVNTILQNQQKQSMLLRTTIKDNRVVGTLNAKARQMISNIISGQDKARSLSQTKMKTENLQEIKKKVRLNKMTSNKVEAIKVKCINEILVKRNHFSNIQSKSKNKKQRAMRY